MKPAKHHGTRQTTAPPVVSPNLVTIGSNVEIGHVVLIFGDPLADRPHFVTFTPDQARGLANGLLLEADKAAGRKPS